MVASAISYPISSTWKGYRGKCRNRRLGDVSGMLRIQSMCCIFRLVSDILAFDRGHFLNMKFTIFSMTAGKKCVKSQNYYTLEGNLCIFGPQSHCVGTFAKRPAARARSAFGASEPGASVMNNRHAYLAGNTVHVLPGHSRCSSNGGVFVDPCPQAPTFAPKRNIWVLSSLVLTIPCSPPSPTQTVPPGLHRKPDAGQEKIALREVCNVWRSHRRRTNAIQGHIPQDTPLRFPCCALLRHFTYARSVPSPHSPRQPLLADLNGNKDEKFTAASDPEVAHVAREAEDESGWRLMPGCQQHRATKRGGKNPKQAWRTNQ
ncbi:hypothetical protein B0H14DRAFT_2599267 [Mycena olivaceomarginata]|nr:hypothetical protein B0H14DRAFT_2599267 [Mycena olivaceomarginata]